MGMSQQKKKIVRIQKKGGTSKHLISDAGNQKLKYETKQKSFNIAQIPNF